MLLSTNIGMKVYHPGKGKYFRIVKIGMKWRDYDQVRVADDNGIEYNFLTKNLQRA